MLISNQIFIVSVTPADYEPPGFQPSERDDFSYEEEPMNIKVGDVSTVSGRCILYCEFYF